MKNYFDQVKEDLQVFMADVDYIISDVDDIEEYEEKIYDMAFISDSVTGNGSGSYTFNSYKARENVLNDMDTVKEALYEFCVDASTIGEKFLNEDWEYLDVTARCYVLGMALGELIEENRDEIEKAIEEAKEDEE